WTGWPRILLGAVRHSARPWARAEGTKERASAKAIRNATTQMPGLSVLLKSKQIAVKRGKGTSGAKPRLTIFILRCRPVRDDDFLIPERLHRVQPCRTRGRIHSCGKADGDGEGDRTTDHPPGNGGNAD